MSDSLWPHDPQHARPPCPSPTSRLHPNPCPLSQWCHPTIASSVILFSSCPQSFPASGSFQMSHLFTLGGQSIGVSASTSVLPMNIQDSSPLEWTAWMSELLQVHRKNVRQHLIKPTHPLCYTLVNIYPQGNECLCLSIAIYKNVYHSQNLQTIQISISSWMDK